MRQKAYEIKYRKKGNIEYTSMWDFHIPEVLKDPDDEYLGIDLTNYTVMYISTPNPFKSNSNEKFEKLKQMRLEMPHAFFIFSNRFEAGEVLLPIKFNASKIRHYKTNSQFEKERERERESRTEKVVEETGFNLVGQLKSIFPEAVFDRFDTDIYVKCALPDAPHATGNVGSLKGRTSNKDKMWNLTIPAIRWDEAKQIVANKVEWWENILHFLKKQTGVSNLKPFTIEIYANPQTFSSGEYVGFNWLIHLYLGNVEPEYTYFVKENELRSGKIVNFKE